MLGEKSNAIYKRKKCVCVCVWSVQAIGGEEKKTMVSVNLVPYTYWSRSNNANEWVVNSNDS